RLSLFDSLGRPLVQSDGQTLGNPDDLVVQHLEGLGSGTTYYLKVEGLGGATGTYTLTTTVRPASSPFQPISLPVQPQAVVTGDFDGDGVPDLAVANAASGDVSVLLG